MRRSLGAGLAERWFMAKGIGFREIIWHGELEIKDDNGKEKT